MAAEPVHYRFRLRPIGPETMVTADADAVTVARGSKVAAVPYREIRAIRLSYKPRNATDGAYEMRIDGGRAVTIVVINFSWKSLLDVDRQDDDYRALVKAVVERTAAAGGGGALIAGVPRWRYALMAGAGAVMMLALGALAIRAATEGPQMLALLFLGLGGYFGWWLQRFFRRNRPRFFTPDQLPEGVLP